MVLFNDTLPPKPPTFIGKCLTWTLRIVILVIALLAFFVGSLNLLQGNGETQKSGIEKTISKLTGKDTYISTLHKFELFPELIFEFDGLKNGLFSDKQINIDSLYFKAKGSTVFNQDGSFRDLNLENIKFLSDQKVIRKIDHIKVSPEEGEKKLLIKTSKPSEALLSISLDSTSLENATDYSLKDGIPFTLEWANNKLSGNYFASDGKRYLHGSGNVTFPSLLPFLSQDQRDIECFVAQISFSDYVITLDNIFIKLSTDSELQRIAPFKFDFFNENIETTDNEEEASSLPEKVLKESGCI